MGRGLLDIVKLDARLQTTVSLSERHQFRQMDTGLNVPSGLGPSLLFKNNLSDVPTSEYVQ